MVITFLGGFIGATVSLICVCVRQRRIIGNLEEILTLERIRIASMLRRTEANRFFNTSPSDLQ